jgi:methionyl-tRNA formyltransferase
VKVAFVSMNRFGHAILEEVLAQKGEAAAIITLKEEFVKGISDYAPFDAIARKHNIPLHKVKNINDEDAKDVLRRVRPDVLFISGWSQIAKPDVLKLAKRGAIGSHPALLPKNRGRAAIPWHFILKEKRGGITFFWMDDGCDSGDIIGQKGFPLTIEDDASTYYDKIIKAGRTIIKGKYKALASGKLKVRRQDERKATYLPKRTPADGLIDWTMPAPDIYDLVRGTTHPYPGAFTHYRGKRLIIWKARPSSFKQYLGMPGQVVAYTAQGAVVRTGDGVLELLTVQEEGGHEQPARSCLKMHDILGYKAIDEIEALKRKVEGTA